MIINLTVDRFEDSNTILLSPDKKTILWPKNQLPKDAKEGSILSFNISSNINKTDNKRQLAKDILNEILNPEESKDL